MTRVLIDARLALRGLGIATFIDRLMAGFAADGSTPPRLWRGSGSGAAGLVSTAARSGLFDLSPRLDPRARRFDVVHFASHLGPVWPGRNSVFTVHDLMHRRWSRSHYAVTGALLERSLTRAGRVVASSEHTRRELERALPPLTGRVELIVPGMRDGRETKADREHVLAFGGAADPRKRTDLMVAVYCAYAAATAGALPLVVLARAGLTPAQQKTLATVGARVVPDATAEEVDAYMAGAAALLYPTQEEGFGLPILEAAEAGTPVVMDAKAIVAAEIVGRHCFMAEGTDVGTWVAALRRAVAAAPVERPLDLPGWPEVAARYGAVYAEVAGW